MRHKLKDAFNSCAHKSRKLFTTLAASFVFATGVGMPPASAQEAPSQLAGLSGVTYWKIAEYDVVGKAEPCPEKGICLSIHNINPEDPRIKTALAELENVRRESPEGGIQELAPERISNREVLSFCGYRINSKLQQDPQDGVWKGTIMSPFNGQTYGLRAKQQEDGTVKLSGFLSWLPFVSMSLKGERIDSPPPACTPYQSPIAPPPPPDIALL